jgi:ATP-dependent Clp protease ATP-binding subunit ClpA
VDCGEFQHSHEISKLVGSPPGYLGHRETRPALCQEVLDQFRTSRVTFSLLLFDEIEKASDALWNLLLGILDKAALTLGDNRRVDFSKVLIFMTSNLGAAEMNSILCPRYGFAASNGRAQSEKAAAGIVRAGVGAARRRFTPEFMNRIDKTVVFRPLGLAELREVLSIELHDVQARIWSAANLTPFTFTVTEAARDYLLAEGTNSQYGARHLKRAIERLVVHPLSNLIATRQVGRGDIVRVDFGGAPGGLLFYRDAERAAPAAMPSWRAARPYSAGAR